MGIGTVAVCSEADRQAQHAQLADQAVCIGPSQSQHSYLHMDAVLMAAPALEAEMAATVATALADDKIAAIVDGATPKKVIVVPGRMVNIVL